MTAFVAVDGLRRVHDGRAVLDGIDLAIGRGETLAVLGPSGSGKTTLLRLLAGFDRADGGTVTLDGVRVEGPGRHHVAAERRRIGYVAQEGALFPHLTVGANVLFGLPRRARRDGGRAASLLELVGLPPAFASRMPSLLSGGEQQRVALARALARAPALVLLDEPFSALDAALRADTRRAVRAALRDTGATALLVTHDQAEALSTGDRVAVLRGGRLAQVADPVTLYRAPVDPALACFVGDAVLLPGIVGGGMAGVGVGAGARVRCALGELSLARASAPGAVTVMIRPEQVRLADGSGRAATVDAVEFLGPDAVLRLVLAGGNGDGDDGIIVSARVACHLCPRPGEMVRVTVDGPVLTWAC